MSIYKGSVEQRPDRQAGDVTHSAIGQHSLPLDQGANHLRLAYSAIEAESGATIVRTRPDISNWRTPSKCQRGLLDRTVQAQIGRMLRDLFSDAAEEAVPERFVRLLEALEAEEKRR